MIEMWLGGFQDAHVLGCEAAVDVLHRRRPRAPSVRNDSAVALVERTGDIEHDREAAGESGVGLAVRVTYAAASSAPPLVQNAGLES